MKILTLGICMLLASCATTSTEPTITVTKGPQYCERQIVTINPFYQHRSYLWIENADGTLDIQNKK